MGKRANALTNESIDKLEARDERYDVTDPVTANLRVRVGRRKKMFVLSARFGNSKHSKREIIGEFPEMGIEDARIVAELWNRQLRQGLDPIEERIRSLREEGMKRRRTFVSVMEDFIADLPNRDGNRHVDQDIGTIRYNLLNPETNDFLNDPIVDVRTSQLGQLIAAVRDRPAPTQALKLYSLMRGFWEWAMAPERREEYGLTVNPFAGVTRKQLKLKNRTRTRSLNARELVAYWAATEDTPYPYGPYYRLVLLLGGRRKSELAKARWSEFDMRTRIWTINDSKTGMKILVPLTKVAIELLEEMRANQHPNHGEYIFSTTLGLKPINGFSKAMAALRKKFLKHLLKNDPAAETEGWVLHDTRRVVRTALAALGVPGEIAERVIGHGPEGIEAVYNQWEYLNQTREALTLFTRRLLDVVNGRVADFVTDDFGDDE
jgi:integrase